MVGLAVNVQISIFRVTIAMYNLQRKLDRSLTEA